MKRQLTPLLVVAALLAGCAAPMKAVAPGDVVVKDRLHVDVATPWNQFDSGPLAQTPTWTNEGITVDALQFWVAVKDGELIAPTPTVPKGLQPLAFRATMQPQQVVELYQRLWSRDGSAFTLERIEPAPFLGGTGFRFDYAVVRKSDDVRLKGMAWGIVRNGELFVISYSAPRLAFFSRYKSRVEAIAASARVRG